MQREEGKPAGCFPLVQRKPGSAVLKMRGKSGPQRRADGAEEELNPGKDPAAGVSEIVTVPVLIPPSTTEVVTIFSQWQSHHLKDYLIAASRSLLPEGAWLFSAPVSPKRKCGSSLAQAKLGISYFSQHTRDEWHGKLREILKKKHLEIDRRIM